VIGFRSKWPRDLAIFGAVLTSHLVMVNNPMMCTSRAFTALPATGIEVRFIFSCNVRKIPGQRQLFPPSRNQLRILLCWYNLADFLSFLLGFRLYTFGGNCFRLLLPFPDSLSSKPMFTISSVGTIFLFLNVIGNESNFIFSSHGVSPLDLPFWKPNLYHYRPLWNTHLIRKNTLKAVRKNNCSCGV